MNVKPFSIEHVPAAMKIAQAEYDEERRRVPVLPPLPVPDLSAFAENGMGVSAFEDGRLVGYLCAYAPFDNAFGTTRARGVFSPVHANGTVRKDRARMYDRMYQSASAIWADAGATSHSVALYAHERQAVDVFFANGFGLRTVDAMRPMTPIGGGTPDGVVFRETKPEDNAVLLPLKNGLIRHLAAPPVFLAWDPLSEEAFRTQGTSRSCRYFSAWVGGKPAAYVEVCPEGENFVTEDPAVLNICGAYCYPEYRSTGLFTQLLDHMVTCLAEEGYAYLGTDFESYNPPARRYWSRHFQVYTYGVVRRIDEGAD